MNLSTPLRAFRNADESPGTRSLCIVMAAAFVLRVIWAMVVPVMPLSDSYAYDIFARNLASGAGYAWGPGQLTAHWPVGTSFVYSLLYRCFGFSYTPVVVFNVCISLGTIWLTMVLGARWFGKQVALYTGLLLAFWPAQIEFVSVLSSELLFNALLLTWLLIWELTRSKAWSAGIILGVVAAATCYVRPIGLLIPVVLLVLDLANHKGFSRSTLKAALTIIITCLLIAPWSVRNTRLFGSFVQISTNGGVNFWEGNNPASDGSTQAIPAETMNMNEALRDQYLGRLAAQYVTAHPIKFVVRTMSKAVRLYSHESIGVYWNQAGLDSRFGHSVFVPLKILSSFYWGCALALGLMGLVSLFRRSEPLSALFQPAVIFWLYFTAVYAVTVIQDRYHFAAVPFVALFAGLALVRLSSLRVRQPATQNAVAVT